MKVVLFVTILFLVFMTIVLADIIAISILRNEMIELEKRLNGEYYDDRK